MSILPRIDYRLGLPGQSVGHDAQRKSGELKTRFPLVVGFDNSDVLSGCAMLY